jgi:hypothetical protein
MSKKQVSKYAVKSANRKTAKKRDKAKAPTLLEQMALLRRKDGKC